MEVMVAAAVTVNDAVADFVVSATAVAVTVTAVSTDTAAAVNSPVLSIIPPVLGTAVHVIVTLDEPVTVASNWIVPPEPTVAGIGSGDVMEIETFGEVTVRTAPLKVQPVASLGAVHPEPVIVALPALSPVTVEPETVAALELEEKMPPVHPDGAEAALVPPTTMVVGLSVTVPVGQLGGGLMPPPPVPLTPQAEKNPATPHNTIKSKLFMGFHLPESQY
jgi:hypothetical protein